MAKSEHGGNGDEIHHTRDLIQSLKHERNGDASQKAEPDQAQSILKWQRVFDDEFAKGATNAALLVVTKAAPSLDLNTARYSDAVNTVRLVGRGILETVRRSLQ